MILYHCGFISFAYFQAPVDEIMPVLRRETKFLLKTQSAGESVISVFDSFNREYPHTKGGRVFYKALFFPCRSTNGAIMLSNLADGWSSLCFFLSGFISGDIYQFALSEHGAQDVLNFMSLFRNQKRQRVIYAMKDPGWVFSQEGQALSFENVAYYGEPLKTKISFEGPSCFKNDTFTNQHVIASISAETDFSDVFYERKKISMRLNKEILTEYCHALHLEVEKEDFWEIQGPSIWCEYRW